MADHLERDLKQALVTVVNKHCNCGFQTLQIEEGEFSCRNVVDGHVVYRYFTPLYMLRTNLKPGPFQSGPTALKRAGRL